MDGIWEYDHKYFQQMIKQDKRMNPVVIGAIITNMSELIKDNSSSKGGLMSGLQERARKDSSSDNDTSSCDDDRIYEDREPWVYKVLTLKQSIGGTPGEIFLNNIPTLYAFSWHRYAKVCESPMTNTRELDFIRPRNKYIFLPA